MKMIILKNKIDGVEYFGNLIRNYRYIETKNKKGRFFTELITWKKKKSRMNLKIKIISIVLLYWIISITLIFLNKIILDNLNAPIFLTWFQCLLTVLILILIQLITNLFKNKHSTMVNHSNNENSIWKLIQNQLIIPTIMIRWNIARRIIPLASIFIMMILFNNLSLQFINISFYFVARSLTPIFNIIFSFLILRKTTSIPAIFTCTGIIIGFIFGKIKIYLKFVK